jgi:hypothetical protein
MLIRNLLWWDGVQAAVPTIGDAELSAPGIARLTGKTAADQPYVAAIKAGHNEENHNQNDIGSFVLHIEGENLLTDPGRGLYSRQYFGPQRYDNIFANSYGHSVPRIGGQLQAPGRQYRGELISVSTEPGNKSAIVEFAGAYPVEELSRATRTLAVGNDGVSYIIDAYEFSTPRPVEEAFVTWGKVEVHGPTATVQIRKHTLQMTIETPVGARFAVESLDEACRVNQREDVLKRLTFVVPAAAQSQARVRMEVE